MGCTQGVRAPGLAALLHAALLSRCSGGSLVLWGTWPPGALLGGCAAGLGRACGGSPPAAGPPAALHLHQLLHRAALGRAQEAPAGAALALGRMHVPRLVQEWLRAAQQARRQNRCLRVYSMRSEHAVSRVRAPARAKLQGAT